jgi:NADPH2:quinone reductase
LRAAWYQSKGEAKDVLKVGEMPDPHPGPGEVRIRVYVSAVNPSDTKQRAGWGGGAKMPFSRIIPHNDGAGVIDAVGAGVSQSRVGERVWIFEAQRDGRAFGTAADFVVLPSANAIQLPDAASMEDGASMGVPGMTAHQLLFRDGGIQGQTVFVAGGAGSVGHITVQLARWAGARVIASVGAQSQAEIARACGAHCVINYKSDDVAAKVEEFTGSANSVDRVIEVAFAKNAELDAKMLRRGGVIATYMIDERDPKPAMALMPLLMKNITVHFTLVYVMSKAAHDAAAAELNAALANKALKPHVARRFTLDQIAEVHEAMGTQGLGGKALLELAKEPVA